MHQLLLGWVNPVVRDIRKLCVLTRLCRIDSNQSKVFPRTTVDRGIRISYGNTINYIAWAAGRPGEEDQMLNTHAGTHAYYGRMAKARDLARQAADSAVRADAKETAAQWLAFQAVREVEVGNASAARQTADRALALDPGRDVKVLSALALARAGESSQSKTIMAALKKSEPSNTFLKVYWFPVLEASMAIAQHAPDRAVIALEPALPYELGNPPPEAIGTLHPAYLRGLAYLDEKNGTAAAS